MANDDRTGDQVQDPDPLGKKLDYLTDLFRRRLVQDTESAKTFDALYQELTAARSAIEGMLVMPLARRMFLLIDRLDQEGSEFGRTVADELAEMLYFQGFTPVVVDSAEFDPATQEAAAIPMAAGNREGQVINHVRRGWRYDGRLIRPALVEVATAARVTAAASASEASAAATASAAASGEPARGGHGDA